jgi:HSP20 family protein
MTSSLKGDMTSSVTAKGERMVDRQGSLQTRPMDRVVSWESPAWREGPFGLFRRFAREMDQAFGSSTALWNPEVDVVQQGDELIVKADLPGLSKDDVTVDVTDDRITIRGERRSEREEKRDGVYHTERSYGSFHRVIPLPEGTITERAKATFRDGVLEIRVPAPPAHAPRGRRLEITDRADAKK